MKPKAESSPFPCTAGEGAPTGAEGGKHSAERLLRTLLSPSPASRGRKILRSFCVALLLALCSNFAYAIDPLPFKDRAEEVRFQQLTRQLRCLVCQNQDLADSDAPLAGDLRRQVFDMMHAGKSDAEIKDYLVARYNDFVLYDPPLKPGTWLLWFTPLALVLIGAFVLLRIVRARARQAVGAQAGISTLTQSKDDDW